MKKLGKKSDCHRPTLTKFSHYQDKEFFLHDRVQINDNYSSGAYSETEQMQDTFLKYCINAPKQCCDNYCRSRIGEILLHLIHNQLIKHFLRLWYGTKNSIVNDAFNCAKTIDSHWIQTGTKFLKSNGFAYDMNCPLMINKGSFHKQFI